MDTDFLPSIVRSDFHCPEAERALRQTMVFDEDKPASSKRKRQIVHLPHIDDAPGLLKSIRSLRSGPGMRYNFRS